MIKSYQELLAEVKKTNELLESFTEMFKEQKQARVSKPQAEALNPLEVPKRATTLDIMLDNDILPKYMIEKETKFIHWVEATRSKLTETDFLRVVRAVGSKAKQGEVSNPRAYLRTSLDKELKKVKSV